MQGHILMSRLLLLSLTVVLQKFLGRLYGPGAATCARHFTATEHRIRSADHFLLALTVPEKARHAHGVGTQLCLLF